MSPVHTPHRIPITRFTASALALVLSGGCAVEEDVDELLDDELPLEIERDGKTFELIGLIVEQEVEPGPDAVIRPLTALPEEPAESRPLTSRSREELADMLRPVIATGGGLYVAQEPAWKAADAVLEDDMEPILVDMPIDDDVEPRAIIGADGRTMIANTQIAPFNSIVKFRIFTGNAYRGWCTGTYIGPRTLVTSAHCMVLGVGDYINRIVFEPARNGNVLPYGAYDCRLDDGNGANDYTWAVPFGFTTNQTESLDFAVIDTQPCHAAPNWIGYVVNAPNASYTMVGYPTDNCPGAPGQDNYQCAMTGPAYINEWRMETQHIDTIDSGDGGSPWYALFDTYRVAGVFRGYREYFDFFRCGFDLCRRNYSRRIDNSFHQFIIDHSFDY